MGLPSAFRNVAFCLLFLLISVEGLSQAACPPEKLDSLKRVWFDLNQPDSNRFRAIYGVSWNCFVFKIPDSAFHYAQLQLDYAMEVNNPREQALALNTQGASYLVRGEFIKAIDYLNKAIKQYEVAEDFVGAAFSYVNLGICYRNLGDLEGGIAAYAKSASIADSLGNKELLSKSLGNMGNIYGDQGNFRKALECHEKSMKLKDEIGDQRGKAASLINLGVINYDIGDLEKAIDYLQQSLEIYRGLDDKRGISTCLTNLASSYADLGQTEIARKLHFESLEIEGEFGNKQIIAGNLFNIGVLFFEDKVYDQALDYLYRSLKIYSEQGMKTGISEAKNVIGNIHMERGNLSEAIRWNQEALVAGQEIGGVVEISHASESLYKAFKKAGDQKKALEMFELFVAMKDSLQSMENRQEVIRQDFQYQYEKQAAADSIRASEKAKVQDALLLAEQVKSKRRQQLSYALVGGLLIALILSGWVYNRYQVTRRQKKVIEEQREKLEELAEFRTRFFTNITHEFRTPLTVILGTADAIKAQSEEVDQIKRNSNRLLNLINQILDLSKLETGKLEVHMKQMEVMGLIKYFADSYRSLLASNQQTLHLDLEAGPKWMDVDEEKLQTLLSNLISNSIKFTPAKGGLWISAKSVGNNLEVRVRDSGPGIPKEELERIFDRFYQVQGKQDRRIGSGVGLALSREIIRVLGGEINVRNAEAGGAEFTFVLPVTNKAPRSGSEGLEGPAKPPEAALNSTQVEEPESDKPMVLIVEDEPDILEFVSKSLRETYSVRKAVNGSQGLDLALEEIPDLIISDVMMPEMDGLEMTDQLKQDTRTSHIPILMLTAKADVDSRLEGLKRGADIYLPKPFNKEELALHLANLLKLRKSIQKHFSGEQGMEEAEVPEQEHAFISRLRTILSEHLDESDFGIEALCGEMGLSRMQLHRKLKALTDQSTTEFINKFKIDEAKKLLLDPELNISQVAYSVGYSDPGYFSRTFQKEVGKSPSEFRQQKI